MVRFILFLATLRICWTHEDFYTAISELEGLLGTHRIVIDDLNALILKEEESLCVLKWNLNLFTEEQERAFKDISNYLSNPIDAYKLIKRLTTGLKEIRYKIQVGIKRALSLTFHHKHMKYPNSKDLIGAVLGLTRLQVIYNLNVQELSQGILNGIKTNPLSSDDCFEIGRVLYYEGFYEYAHTWMQEAHKLHKQMDVVSRKTMPSTNNDILEYIGKCTLDINILRKGKLNAHPAGNYQLNGIRHTNKISMLEIKTAEQNIALCRGEMNVSANITKRLKCRFSSKYHPFLKYAPIKVEQVYIEPDIYIFHEVLSDFEIEHIKSLSKPKLQRSFVSEGPSYGEPSDVRISKSAALLDQDSSIIARITQRINYMTGLDMLFSEELQVVNYGIGGYYGPHYDFAEPGGHMEKRFKKVGNRIATVLLYMSDVAQGGATIFIKLGLSIFPIKRAALYWPNLHQTGECDLATYHAACPVVKGSKWVGTKWIHEAGQELNRPCKIWNTIHNIIRNQRI